MYHGGYAHPGNEGGMPGGLHAHGGPGLLPGQKPRNKMMISKNDKRRHYAKMYSEAFNSGDPKQLLHFLEQYCTPDCVVIQRCVVKENPFIPKYLEIHGISAIHQFWSNTFIIIPDCLIVMLETKLRIRNRMPPSSATGVPGSAGIGTTGNGLSNVSSQQNLTTYEGNIMQNLAQVPNTPNDNSSNQSLIGTGTTVSPNTTSSSSNTNPNVSANEGSSIVSSFSFTGTKIYTMDMEGAILQDENIQTLTTANSAASDFHHAHATNDTNNSTVQALIAKSQQRVNKKRAHNSDWPGNITDVTGSTSGSNSTAVSTAGGPEAPSNNTVDRYNIFLHPPRRFSTLAGTPFGGNASHYTNHSAKQYSALTSIQRAALNQPNMFSSGSNSTTSNTRVSDYVSINANTKMRAGKLIDKEGLINFLGTLTMTLDADNKIAKFEFLYSHLD